MITGSLLLSAVLHLNALAAPSVAVLTLEHKQGVTQDVADLLTENLSATVRETHRFSKVIGTKDIEQVLGFEKQKQLLACESSSCMAELAGALGVDYVLSGTLGRLGSTWLFNAVLFNQRTGDAEARLSRKIKGTDEEALLEAVEGIVADLLKESRVPPVGGAAAAPAKPAVAAAQPAPTTSNTAAATPAPSPTAAAEPAPAPAPSTETAAASSTSTGTSGGGGGIAGKALMGIGAAGLAATLIPLALAAVGLATSLGILAAFNTGALQGTHQGRNASYAYVGGYVVMAGGLALSLLTIVAGGALLGTGVVLN